MKNKSLYTLKNSVAVSLTLMMMLTACKQEAEATATTPVVAKGETSKAITVLPHKALYDFKLISAKRNTQIVDVKGQMAFEWESTCEGWATNQNYVIRYDYTEGLPVEMTSNFATWESVDGSSFQFSAHRVRGEDSIEDIRGSVSRDSKGELKITYNKPEDIKIETPVGTMFPTQHTLALIENALKGEKFFPAILFDGSDTEGSVDVSAVITHVSRPDKKFFENKEIDSELLQSKAWSVRLAFFPRDISEEALDMTGGLTSDYEMTMILHENGVVSDMHIDYADFSLRSSLKALEKITPATCD